MERTITGTVGEVKGRTVNTKYGEKTVFDITIGSQKTSTFKSDIAEEANALKGSDVEATVRVEPREGYPDNYMLQSVKLVDAYPAAAVPVTSAIATSTIPAGSTITVAPAADARQESIVRQSSVKAAAAVYSGSGADAEEVLVAAQRFFDWCQGNVMPYVGNRTETVTAAAETNDGIEW